MLNSKLTCFILVPSAINSGPIKGAVALANQLSNFCGVHLLFLKGGDPSVLGLVDCVQVHSLSYLSFFRKIIYCLRFFSRYKSSGSNIASLSCALQQIF